LISAAFLVLCYIFVVCGDKEKATGKFSSLYFFYPCVGHCCQRSIPCRSAKHLLKEKRP
jgi:hypothetical protein